jgi:hypothetical protein
VNRFGSSGQQETSFPPKWRGQGCYGGGEFSLAPVTGTPGSVARPQWCGPIREDRHDVEKPTAPLRAPQEPECRGRSRSGSRDHPRQPSVSQPLFSGRGRVRPVGSPARRLGEAEESRTLPTSHPRPWRRDSVFGDGRRAPLDRNGRARFRFLIRAHRRARRLTRAGLDWARTAAVTRPTPAWPRMPTAISAQSGERFAECGILDSCAGSGGSCAMAHTSSRPPTLMS